MRAKHRTFLVAATIFILTAVNAFPIDVYFDGRFTFPFPKKKTPEEIVVDPPKIKDTITIASFNIQVFGKTKSDDRDIMHIIAQIMSKFDIIAIQEIRDATGIAIKTLEFEMDAYAPDYDYIINPRLERTLSKGQYAFMYNTRTISVGKSYTFDDPADFFHTDPFIAGFSAVGGNFDFVLITLYADPNDAAREINAMPMVVKDAHNHFPEEKDFIILGDLNADCNYFDENDPTSPMRSPQFVWLITNDMDTSLAVPSCTYDRIIVPAAMVNEDYAGQSGVFRFDRAFGLNKKDAKKISDHYPVYSVFYVNRDSD